MATSATVGSADLDRLAASVRAAYEARTPESGRWHERARSSLTGGVTGNLRYFAPYPLYFESGEGAMATDIDGNRYVDTFLCNGPLLLGHRHPRIVEAVEDSRQVGPLVLNPRVATMAAEAIISAVPSAESVRFLSTGTEAVTAALRYSRAFTGRAKVIKFFGHYHGMDDQVLVGIGPSDKPMGPGIPSSATESTLLVPFGDSEALADALRSDPDVAAVILDPAMHNGGLWGTSTAYLQAVRDLTHEAGSVLIFDEVITGFRLSAGGAQRHYGVAPDLTTLGKALGAGERVSAVAGRREVMQVADPGATPKRSLVFQSGTANDGTSGLAAAIAAISTYQQLQDDGEYEALSGRAERLADGLMGAFAEHGIGCHINQLGSMLQLFLTSEAPSFERFIRLDTRRLNLFFLAMMTEGSMLTLPGSNHVYLSFAHGDAEIDSIIASARRVLDTFDLGIQVG